MYCNYNVKLFKPFVSMKTKVIPAMANDWEIIPDTYRGNDGFKLHSKKLNQTVADIDLRRFLKFSKENNLVIDSLLLQGNYIIGNDRSVYTKDMYNIWKNKYDERTESLINKKDLIPGAEYETPCGSHFIYLGKYYTINFKQGDIGLDNLSKIKLVHLISNKAGENAMVLNQKVNKKISENVFDTDKIDKLVENYKKNYTVAYLGKDKIIPKAIKLKEINEPKEHFYIKYFEYGEVIYENKKIIVTSTNPYLNASVINFDKEYKEKCKVNHSNYTHNKQEHTGKLTKLNGLSIFDEKTLTYDKETFKDSWKRNKPIYSAVTKFFTLEVIG